MAEAVYRRNGLGIVMLKLKGCIRCGGDLKVDERDWQCLQCGHYYYDGITFGNELSLGDQLDSMGLVDARPMTDATWRGARKAVHLRARRPNISTAASSRATRGGKSSMIPRKLAA